MPTEAAADEGRRVGQYPDKNFANSGVISPAREDVFDLEPSTFVADGQPGSRVQPLPQ